MGERVADPARPLRRVFVVGGAPDPRDVLDPLAPLRATPPAGWEVRDVGPDGDLSIRAFKRAFRPDRDAALFDATRPEIAFDLEEAYASAPGGVVVGPETLDAARILELGAPILALGLGPRAPLSRAATLRSRHAAVRPPAKPLPIDDELIAVFGGDAALYAAMMWRRSAAYSGRLRLIAMSAASANTTRDRLRRLDLAAEVVAAPDRAAIASAAVGAGLTIELRAAPAQGETDVMRAAARDAARLTGPLDALADEIEATVAAGARREPAPTPSSSADFTAACLRIGRIALARRFAAAS